MPCNGNKADTCGGAGHINIYTAQCTGLPGCHFGYGFIREIDGLTLHGCNEACHADAECVAIQAGHEAYMQTGTDFCNLFRYPPAVIKAQGLDNDARCNAFTFFDTSCNL